ncbi:MAG TPA: nucleoside hydrolase [Chitinophagaceae bacterium]|jgi:inosine-uridine nucleoside N-ribohydrolase|nr:nucleoside hydrolase [Chitinophagaceae bacterium]
MLQKIFFCCCILFCFAYSRAQKAREPVAIIFDSDMGPDYDDVGAITLLHAFADSGKAKILATIASTKYEGVACVMNVFNTYFHQPHIPIGVPKGIALTLKDWQHWTDTLIVSYPHKIKSNEEVMDAVELYRKILSAQPDHSVTIVTVGFLTNLSNLLQSKTDHYSSLNGKELVKRKVKQLVCMAGRFPAGKEFNIDRDASASQYVFLNWPTFILFSGFEVGQKIKTGLPLIHNTAIQNDPVKTVFSICIPKAAEDSAGRMSWDETAVLVAVKGFLPYYQLEYGHIEVATDGSNTWNSEGRQHAHLVENVSPSVVQAYINKLLMHQPVKR